MPKKAKIDPEKFFEQAKMAKIALGKVIMNSNVHRKQKFMHTFKETFSELFRNSMHHFDSKESLSQTSKVIYYLETLLHPNIDPDLSLHDLSPELQYLLFLSINRTYEQL